MNPLRAWIGRWLEMPAPRCRAERSFEWVPMRDGARLATLLQRPATGSARAVVLMRTIGAPDAPRRATTLLARLLAEQGHVVATQQCRGLGASEGRFEPFLHDGDDGAATLDWLCAQPGCDGPVALLGFGYAGHAAFATLARSARSVAGLAAGFAARDPYAWLHRGGALELAGAFELALPLAAAEPEGTRAIDLPRALRFRPLREADRVAARRIDWLRGWLDHPERDAFWEERSAALPERAPQSLLVTGFRHPTLQPLLDDHRALAELAERSDAPRPRLVIGPWGPATAQRRRTKGARLVREVARETAQLLERVCGEAVRPAAPLRVFVQDRGWRETSGWPPAGDDLVLHLSGDGRDEGELRREAPDTDAPPDTYLYDPADGGAEGGGDGAPGPEGDRRGDTLHYASAPQERGLELAGPVHVELFASSDAPRTDFTAQLLRVGADGSASPLSFGIARVDVGEAPTRVSIELSPCWQRVAAGERLGLEIASCGFPRFDRHPNTGEAPVTAAHGAGRPARQRVYHDPRRPSALRLRVARG